MSALDQEFGAIAPSFVEFDGDIIAVEVQEPKEEWIAEAEAAGKTPPGNRIRLVVRDWDRTLEAMEKGEEFAKCRYPKAISVSTSARSVLSAIRSQAKKELGVDLTGPRTFEGLAARFRIEDKGIGTKFEQKDLLSIVGKPSQPKPEYLTPLKPRKDNADESPEADVETTITVSAEALEAIRGVIGDERDPATVRRMLRQDKAFKGQYGAAFAAVVQDTESVLANV